MECRKVVGREGEENVCGGRWREKRREQKDGDDEGKRDGAFSLCDRSDTNNVQQLRALGHRGFTRDVGPATGTVALSEANQRHLRGVLRP